MTNNIQRGSDGDTEGVHTIDSDTAKHNTYPTKADWARVLMPIPL